MVPLKTGNVVETCVTCEYQLLVLYINFVSICPHYAYFCDEIDTLFNATDEGIP